MTDFSRLDELTQLMTRAMDQLRSLAPGDQAERARVSAVRRQVREERGQELARLCSQGVPLRDAGARLDRTDPYRRGVPDNRPVPRRQDPPDRTRGPR